MTHIHSITATPALGPVYVKSKARNKYSHAESETPSLTDRVVKDETAPSVNCPDCIYSNLAPALSTKQLLLKYKDMMNEHIDRRICFFFQQLIACYQTKLHFESEGALDQAKPATAINVKKEGKICKLTKRNAAHSSTHPCLIAYDETEWQAFIEGRAPKPQGFVFLKGTDYYRLSNATMNMPDWINQADITMDGKNGESKLRDKTLDLINKAAQGEVSPDQGVFEFTKLLLAEINAAQKKLKREGGKCEVQVVLGHYKARVEEIAPSLKIDEQFFKTFLNLNVSSNATDSTLKSTLLHLRYKAIRGAAVNQASLIQKIEAVKKEIFASLKVKRQPDHFNAVFKTLLIESMRSIEDKHRVKKLLNFNPEAYKGRLVGGTLSKFHSTTEKIQTQAVKIVALGRELSLDIRRLGVEERQERATTLKSLREAKDWTQTKLGTLVAQKFPRAAASQSTISRLERWEKIVTPQIATEFSAVFQVDSGLFMPQFFWA